MSDYYDMIKKITIQHHDAVKKSWQFFFDCFNANHFWYYRLMNNGYISFLDSNPTWCEYFASQKFYLEDPFVRHPKFVQEGVYITKDQEDEESFGRILTSGRDKFSFQVNLRLLNKIPGGIEEFGFSFKHFQTSMIFNTLPLIRLFTKKFHNNNQTLDQKLREYQIDLASLIGPNFYLPHSHFDSQNSKNRIFLEKMGVRSTELTLTEKEVIQNLLNGYSAGKTASKMFRSKRTVEHHIERIKEKLSCSSKAELIQTSRELEQLGYLMF
jgi:DNA-binding CsgD family transcriptional regulator